MATSAEWGLQFQELAADATQAYARGVKRYGELLNRVSHGELLPDAVQRQYHEYFQEHATGLTRELVETSVGLLVGLLHIEARYRDAMLDGLVPPGAPTPPPPSPSKLDVNNWFQALSTYAAEQSARAVSRHQQLVDRISTGQITSAQVQEHGRRFVESEAPRFLADVMQLGLGFVRHLQGSSASLTDGLYDRVLGPEPVDPGPPNPPLCVNLRGPSGSDAAACVVIENARDASTQVDCQVSQFVSLSGSDRFDAPIEITPSRFSLARGEQRDLEIRLHLDPERFKAGNDYVATLLISGAGEREQVVQLIARADGQTAALDPRSSAC